MDYFDLNNNNEACIFNVIQICTDAIASNAGNHIAAGFSKGAGSSKSQIANMFTIELQAALTAKIELAKSKQGVK